MYVNYIVGNFISVYFISIVRKLILKSSLWFYLIIVMSHVFIPAVFFIQSFVNL